MATYATPKALKLHDIEQMSADDEELKIVRQAIRTGKFQDCKQYAPVANDVSIVGQVVLRNTRIVLPTKLCSQAIALAHEGHLGVVGTKQNLRTKLWWPGMDRNVERYCRACHGCQLVAKPDPPEPIRSTRLPEGPWQDLAIDLLGPFPSGPSILVIVDYYSCYYEYDVLMSTTTTFSTLMVFHTTESYGLFLHLLYLCNYRDLYVLLYLHMFHLFHYRDLYVSTVLACV